MDDRDYQLLLDLFESKNITKVARKHYLSQPAMTKRIQRIEAELGAPLLLRGKTGVIFTAAGERLIPYCRQIVQQAQCLRDAVQQSQGVVGGTLNVFASINYGHYRLPTAIKLYAKRYPQVEINVSTGKSKHIYQQFLRQQDCLAILRGELGWDGEMLPLSTEPMCLVTSHENTGRPLHEYSYIGHHTDASVVAEIERWGREQGLSLRTTRLWVDDINSCKEMTRCGIGWCILPRICLDDFDGEVRELTFADGTPMTRSTYVLYRGAYAQLQQVRLFLEVLAENERAYA